MDREQLKERLLKAGFEADLVDDLLLTLKDGDLLRMKEMSPEEIVVALKQAVEQQADTEEADPEPEGDVDAGDTTNEGGDADIAAVLKDFGDSIVQRVVEELKVLEVAVETPDLAEIVTQLKELKDEYVALQTLLKEMQGAWDEILKTDTERLRERLNELSPVQRVRLQATLGDKEAMERVTQFLRERNAAGETPQTPSQQVNVFRAPVAGPGEVIWRDVDGNEYDGGQDFAFGNKSP